jgi:hypothetical protein
LKEQGRVYRVERTLLCPLAEADRGRAFGHLKKSASFVAGHQAQSRALRFRLPQPHLSGQLGEPHQLAFIEAHQLGGLAQCDPARLAVASGHQLAASPCNEQALELEGGGVAPGQAVP